MCNTQRSSDCIIQVIKGCQPHCSRKAEPQCLRTIASSNQPASICPQLLGRSMLGMGLKMEAGSQNQGLRVLLLIATGQAFTLPGFPDLFLLWCCALLSQTSVLPCGLQTYQSFKAHSVRTTLSARLLLFPMSSSSLQTYSNRQPPLFIFL